MTGFFHYFLSVLDSNSIFGFWRALPVLMVSAYLPWWLLGVLPVARWFLPDMACWLVYLSKPAIMRPALPVRAFQAEPFVSVVIAGRNESASIEAAIRASLLCGYGNIEVIFVDDCSDDDSIPVARRAARSLFPHGTDRVRIFSSPRRNGKASALNIGIRMARGKFIAIIDADSALQYGAMHHWLLPFADPRVGAVAANLRVRNSTDSIVTRLQECEYAFQVTMARLAAARVGLLTIIPGAGGLFRAEIIHRLGGYDTGLGDDTDMTIKLRKQRWKLGFAVDAVVWTDVPVTWRRLCRQRIRWERNMVKIRLSKHRDMLALGRYGLGNAIVMLDLLIMRITFPWVAAAGLLAVAVIDGPLSAPALLTDIYWVYLIWLFVKALIARDVAHTPQRNNFPLLLVFPLYKLGLRVAIMSAELAELLRIGIKHPYVPDHVWQETPWW
jgi:cellulose synthase/poly-beta-1,6-N-acetylglucosamine synthase-like glycosyltransferase